MLLKRLITLFLNRTFPKTLLKKNKKTQNRLQKNSIYTDTLEATKNDVVPMSGLVWHCKFTPWNQMKKMKNTWSMQCLKKQELTENSSTDNRKKACERKDGVDKQENWNSALLL